MQNRMTLRLLLLILCAAINTFAQTEPHGGTVPGPPTKPKETTTPKAPAAPRRTGALDRIDGKWWTTGNGFGDSELILTQNGANITGVINWADGRTGTLNGTLVGKRLQHTWTSANGDGGAGWLELSWANFLGGPWKNARVKDGSWTLNRIEGQWCLNGDRKRPRTVSHDAKGELSIVTEDGTRYGGNMEGPYFWLDNGGDRMKGDMFYKGNKLTFPNGSFWTWCGR
ncbi:MAG: hypothetical protein DMF69_03460 [Acidobacteria bacterium]|nr:MAG: hypothetical protein DMF69_03460 [Acidobacteriota bacterium]